MVNNVGVILTGDCQNSNSGAYNIKITGSSPDYRIEFISPSVPTSYICNGCTVLGSYIYLGPQETEFTAYNLSGGFYSLVVYDSDTPSNANLEVTFNISTGTCVNVTSVQNTTCGLNNGFITASTSNSFGSTRNFSLYDGNNNFITSATTPNNFYVFGFSPQLSAGTYYVVANDGGGCSGRSESVIIKSSVTLDYSFYVIDTSPCINSLGKIYVTGLTGTYPYTYQWSNGVTGQDFITGLTLGAYSVTVTDGSGCQLTKSTVVSKVNPIQVSSVQSNNPSCFGNDGEITIFVNGGSPPYIWSGSNGVTDISLLNQYTFSGLVAGSYSFKIIDAGLCETTTFASIIPANSFSVQSVNIANTNCNNSGGKIRVNLNGAFLPIYSYELSGSSGVLTAIDQGPSYEFTNLTTGFYQLTVSGSGPTSCVFTNTYEIKTTVPFIVSASTTGTTCGRRNGVVDISVDPTYLGSLIVELQGTNLSQIMNNNTARFINLKPGTYYALVTNTDNGCSNGTFFTIDYSIGVDFLPPTVVNNSISVSIIQGQPPFTVTWSGVTSGILPQNGITATGLTNDDYIVIVTDSNGCIKTSQVITIDIPLVKSNTSSYSLCSNNFVLSPLLTQKKLVQIFYEGYLETISDETSCTLIAATFINNVVVNNVLYTDTFYVANDIFEAQDISDVYWIESTKKILESIYGIGEVIIDEINNKIIINTDCEVPNNLLIGAKIVIDVSINYDINCRFCNSLFRNCFDSNDEIVVGIISDNFMGGDIVKYNNKCYELTSDKPSGLSVTTRNYPDYMAGFCSSCDPTNPPLPNPGI